MYGDRVGAGLDALGREDRALIELSEVRQVALAAIAELLGIEEDEVAARRQAAFARLAEAVGAESAAQRADLLAELRGGQSPVVSAHPASGGHRQSSGEQDQPHGVVPADGEPRRPSLAITGVVMLLLAAAVALPLAFAGGDDDEPPPETAPTETAERTEKVRTETTARTDTAPRTETASEPAPEVTLRAVAGGSGSGTALVIGETLRISLRDLPDPGRDRYTVWLYDSLSRSRQIATLPRGELAVDVPLPSDLDRFRFLDVSVEPDDGNRNHGGQSVMRAPLDSLRTTVR